ncbi:hypothetical protein [Kineosporia sp. R_H_3]|uniref:hypothetical protein n=1 Tax=Kineosporia sp. R_H_3 TaxID=1961848 RepID=UPI000B4B79BE|nr:hypothetical protein [Kineosporia sp. R_H_3]
MTTRTDGPDWFHANAPGDEPVHPVDGAQDDGAPDDGAQVDDAPRGDAAWDDDDLLDADRAPRTNRLTVVLAVAVVAACTFTAGALVQRELGGSDGSAAAAGGLPSGFPGGLGAAGFPGGGEVFPGGGAAAATGGPGQAGAVGGTAGTATAAAPVVVGTVTSVEGTTLVVENFAGARVTVTVPATATVTAPGLGGVRAGMTVSVVGSKQSSTAVTATAVTARKAS